MESQSNDSTRVKQGKALELSSRYEKKSSKKKWKISYATFSRKNFSDSLYHVPTSLKLKNTLCVNLPGLKNTSYNFPPSNWPVNNKASLVQTGWLLGNKRKKESKKCSKQVKKKIKKENKKWLQCIEKRKGKSFYSP